VAAALRQEPDLQVDLVNGDPGEFTVFVDGRMVAGKGESLPGADEVLAAVRGAGAATAR
jgi:hypothetical protein